jgi:cardiolipin synthase
VLVAKQVADVLTFIRAFISFLFVWLGLTQGVEGLPHAILFLTLAWTTDALDGPLARRSSVSYRSWIGDHDLEVDMLVSAGLLGYLWTTGFVSTLVAVIYVLAWTLIFFYIGGIERTLGMLSQAPIYGGFILISMLMEPLAGRWLLLYLLAIVVVTWPRFPREVVPGFLSGMSRLYNKYIKKGINS